MYSTVNEIWVKGKMCRSVVGGLIIAATLHIHTCLCRVLNIYPPMILWKKKKEFGKDLVYYEIMQVVENFAEKWVLLN